METPQLGRWVVERAFACLNRHRHLAKDREKSIASSEAWLLIANMITISRKIALERIPKSGIVDGPLPSTFGKVGTGFPDKCA